mmetsp:Transcript_14938/g.22978  ORF Transcript_14938/g.22978 Transcript_14938/m.22978 type:complete len:204 (-) Transcript_14938:75-686(-)
MKMFLAINQFVAVVLIAFPNNVEGFAPPIAKHKTRVSFEAVAKEEATTDWFSFAENTFETTDKKEDDWIIDNFNKKLKEVVPQELLDEDTSESTELFSFGLKHPNPVETSKLSKVADNKEGTASEWFSFALHNDVEKEEVDSAAWINEHFNKMDEEEKAQETYASEWFSVASREGACTKPPQSSSRVAKPTDKADWFSFASQQ